MKTVLFVPGFQENLRSRNYKATISAITQKGYRVVFVHIKWKRTTIEDWVVELNKVYEGYNPKDTILAGFSFGAITAFVSATKRNPAELWLFSLSPYFAKDLKSKNMKNSWLKIIGHRRVSAFSKLDFVKLSKTIKCKTLLFAGQLEIDKWPVIGERATQADKLMVNSRLTIVQNTGHDVTSKDYIKAITKLI